MTYQFFFFRKILQPINGSTLYSFFPLSIRFIHIIFISAVKQLVKLRSDLTSLDLYNKSVDYLNLYGYTTRVTGLTGDNFHFDNNGDGPARYNIIHFKQVEPGTFKWIKVGVYSDGKLNLNMDGEYFI